MASTTIQLSDLEKYADTIYEAIVVIAKRAKQINDEQKAIFETEVVLDEESDEFNDEEENESVRHEEQDYVKLPKPTKLAIEELLTGKIKFEYLDKEEDS